jgi:hypothetical protein
VFKAKAVFEELDMKRVFRDYMKVKGECIKETINGVDEGDGLKPCKSYFRDFQGAEIGRRGRISLAILPLRLLNRCRRKNDNCLYPS